MSKHNWLGRIFFTEKYLSNLNKSDKVNEVESFNNFAITSYGGSGTKFLAEMMNKSDKWTVLHEPHLSTNFMAARFCQERFNNNYGEVNSYLRFCFQDLKVAKKGVIKRPIKDAYISWWSQKGEHLNDSYYYDLEITLHLLDELYENNDILLIDFNRMVANVSYINGILKHFGIEDVKLTKEDLAEKINPHRKEGDTWEMIPDKHKSRFLSIAEWYIEKWDK